jgi:EpsI family protein
MPESNTGGGILKNRYARILTGVLLLQAAGFYAVSRREAVLPIRPLEELPTEFQAWRMVRADALEPLIVDVLRADDVVSRVYLNQTTGRAASLFVAFFGSQRAGQAPHSPKNCMPGSGWAPMESGAVEVRVPGMPAPIRVNRYIVAKGEQKSLVLYWYQTRNRVIASEYAAKFYQVADAIRYNRTDTALVRVVVPLSRDQSTADAVTAATQFVQSFFASLRQFLPA